MVQTHLLLFVCCYGVLVAAIRPSPPLITKQPPTDEIVFQVAEKASGDDRAVLIECEAVGEPAPTFQWFKNGQLFEWQAYDDRITMQPGRGSLVISKPRDEDIGQYQCLATNQYGTATSNSVFVRKAEFNSVKKEIPQILTTLPFFTKEPELVTAAEEDDATFYCEAQGFPVPNIKWTFNGKPIAEAPVNNRRVVKTNSITIKNLVKSDTGNYGCNATNILGYVYRDVYLNVLDVPPEIEYAPGMKATIYGRNITLTCKVFGVPKPTVEWIKDGTNLNGGRFNVLNDGSLEINNVSFTDAGKYQCHASNKFGSNDANVTLSVKPLSYTIDLPEDYQAVAGSPATFRCDAVPDSDDLELNVKWLKDGEIIDYSDSRFRKLNDNALQISKTFRLDSGLYTCVVYSDLDHVRVEASATLTVKDVPNTPR